eukprot:371308-Hanusia_phi.AAC.4
MRLLLAGGGQHAEQQPGPGSRHRGRCVVRCFVPFLGLEAIICGLVLKFHPARRKLAAAAWY